ncbi:MAG: hypothetical protein AAGG09_07075 [Pseudomonadota bacterium]
MTLQDRAVHRKPGHGLYFTNANLMGLTGVFSGIRYSYEASLEYTAVQNRARAEDWLRRGAPLDDADVRTHAEAVSPMSFALADHLCKRLRFDGPNLYRLF